MTTKTRESIRTTVGNLALAAVTFVILVGGWEAIVRWLDVPSIVLPGPFAIFEAFWKSFGPGVLLYHTGVTMYEIVLGFLLGSICGLLLGFGIALSPLAERIFYPYVIAFQTIPKVAIAPIIVIWFGYGVESKVIITATIAFFPLLANTIMGLRAAPMDQIDMLVTSTATRWQVFRLVRLPQALPYVFVGLDVAIILSVIGAIVGEFVGSKAGLGYLILQKNFLFDMPGTFAVLIILSVLGMSLHWIISFMHRKIVFWIDVAGENVTGA